MATPETVLVHISPERFSAGFYRLDGDRLIMTDHTGRDIEPAAVHHMRLGDDAKVMAAILTKEIRSRMVNPFWDDIKMPENGVA